MKRIFLILFLVLSPLIGSLLFNFLMDFYNIPAIRSKSPDPYNIFGNLLYLSVIGIITAFISIFSKKYNIYYKITFFIIFAVGAFLMLSTIDAMSKI